LPMKSKYFSFGRIDPKKAIENLINALAQSDTFRRNDFHLKIVGDHHNEYGSMLEQLVETTGLADKVNFLGHRSGAEKQALLAGAWFLIMPSHTENFGIVVTEALAQGTPAVASTGTPWKILEEREAGYWVANDPRSLTPILENIQSLSPQKMTQLSNNAFKLATEEFSIHANVSEWETAYQALLK
ncbi:MAG: glycosyltransferase family 4 protein, partial [Bacteroidota bacterium]